MTITIAHQLPKHLEASLTAQSSGHSRWLALLPDKAYEIPAGVEILLATVPRGGNVAVPSERPPGWPGQLRWLHTVSTGIDEFPPWIFDVPVVTCSRGASSIAIAEYVLSAILLLEKQLPDIWVSDPDDWTQRDLGTLEGKTLGLLGFGSIAQAIAKRALSFNMRILAHRRTESAGDTAEVEMASLERVMSQADHLVVTLPLTDQTYHLLNRKTFSLMKPTAHLVNVSRGGIVDQDHLVEALDDGKLGFATLDVTEPEPLPKGHALYRHPKIRVSPHISWSGGDRMGFVRIFQENLTRFIRGEELLNRVYPETGY